MKLEKIIEKYSETTSLRIMTSTLIPVFGPIIDQILGNYSNSIYQKRVEYALDILDQKLQDLENALISNNFIKSESFFDIFVQYLENSIKTRNKEKIQYYARILINTITFPNKIEFDEMMMKQISLLTTNDLLLMRFMFQQNQKNKEFFTNPNYIKGGLLMKQIPDNTPTNEDIPELSDLNIKISLNTITATGFVKEFSGAAGDYKGGWYYITPLLIETIRVIIKNES